MMRKISRKIFICILIFVIFLVKMLLDENVSQNIYIFFLLLLGVWILIKGLEISGIPELITVVGLPCMPVLTKLFASSPFAKNTTELYNSIITIVFKITGIHSNYTIGSETCITLTFWLLFAFILFIYSRKDHTAMKVRKGSEEKEFKEKNYTQKSEMFCKTLRQRLESINRETDWNENLFTPIQAEVEVNINGKRKKKFEDLLKCLKSIRHRGAIFLILGEPGAGKSVSLRKLCLDLLEESKKTKKIPVYINLKKWNKDWSLDCLPNKKDLINFIKDILYENGDIFTDNFLNTYFYKMLEDGRWYFIFDSFDEMPCLMGRQNCQELIDRISELLCQFMTGANQSGGIIASRMYKSPSEAIGATVILKIQEFNDIKIKTMLQKYLNNARVIINELFGKRESLVVLSRNPFYLTLLINYIQDNGLAFPENQMDLYRNFVERRLKKCTEKFQNEHITMQDVHNAAKRLAVFMQRSSIYGLECPITELFQGNDEQYWRKSLKLLEYAKICRLGGTDETVSFVHRRFQEFFFVESIIECGNDIEYEKYRSIVGNSSMRDALVLYCEVINEEKAKEIAKFCWYNIQQNIVYKKNILEKGSIELANSLYFMVDAFRNRKSVIAEFKEELEQLLDNALCWDTDFVILLACTNCMALFEQKYLQKMALKVFRLRNRWLNDIIIQNCRIFDRLDGRIETQFTNYFCDMDIHTFLSRFQNTRFSLSLSKNFKYIKTVHFMIFLLYISCIVVTFTTWMYAIIHFNQYVTIVMEFIKKTNVTDLITIDPTVNKFDLYFILLSFSFAILFSNVIPNMGIRIFSTKVALCWIILFQLPIILMPINVNLAIIIGWIIIVMILILIFTILLHEIYYKLKLKELKKIWNMNKISKICKTFILTWILGFTLIQFMELINIFFLSVLVILFILSIIIVIIFAIDFLHDWNWIRNQVELRSMTRECVAQNLKQLKVQRFRCAYIERLLLQKVQLTGEWPDNERPQYEDDKLDLYLAKLDCLKLESCNYLF